MTVADLVESGGIDVTFGNGTYRTERPRRPEQLDYASPCVKGELLRQVGDIPSVMMLSEVGASSPADSENVVVSSGSIGPDEVSCSNVRAGMMPPVIKCMDALIRGQSLVAYAKSMRRRASTDQRDVVEFRLNV